MRAIWIAADDGLGSSGSNLMRIDVRYNGKMTAFHSDDPQNVGVVTYLTPTEVLNLISNLRSTADHLELRLTQTKKAEEVA